jgi:hypothetical protein
MVSWLYSAQWSVEYYLLHEANAVVHEYIQVLCFSA